MELLAKPLQGNPCHASDAHVKIASRGGRWRRVLLPAQFIHAAEYVPPQVVFAPLAARPGADDARAFLLAMHSQLGRLETKGAGFHTHQARRRRQFFLAVIHCESNEARLPAPQET